MELNIWTFFHMLSNSGIDAQARIKGNGTLFSGVFMFDDDRTMDTTGLYICDDPQAYGWDDSFSVAFVVKADTIAARSLSLACAYNKAMRFIQYFESWETHLASIMFKHKPLQAMLDATQEILPYPMKISNLSTKVLAISAWERPIPDPTFAYIKEYGFMPSTNVEAMADRSDSISIHSAHKAHILKRAVKGIEYEFVRANLWMDGSRIGSISMYDAGSGFRQGDLHILDMFTKHVERCLKLHSSTYISESLLGNFLTEAIHSGDLNRDILLQILGNIGWAVDDNYTVIRAEPLNLTAFTSYIKRKCDDIQERIKDSCLFKVNDGIVILVNNRNADSHWHISDSLKEFIEDKSILIGVSFPFSNLTMINGYYHQACQALSYGKCLEYQSPVFTSDIAMDEISKLAKNDKEQRLLIHPDIEKLLQHDSDNGTELAITLYHYLFWGCQYTEAANSLGVHRNTMRYRMSKIEELLTIDLNSVKNRRLLLISCMLFGIPFQRDKSI